MFIHLDIADNPPPVGQLGDYGTVLLLQLCSASKWSSQNVQKAPGYLSPQLGSQISVASTHPCVSSSYMVAIPFGSVRDEVEFTSKHYSWVDSAPLRWYISFPELRTTHSDLEQKLNLTKSAGLPTMVDGFDSPYEISPF
jgi:hypothetical protein